MLTLPLLSCKEAIRAEGKSKKMPGNCEFGQSNTDSKRTGSSKQRWPELDSTVWEAAPLAVWGSGACWRALSPSLVCSTCILVNTTRVSKAP